MMEVGEVAEAVHTHNGIANELADIVIICDLMCQKVNASLGQKVAFKFNDKSKRIGSDIVLKEAPHAR